MRGLKRLTGSEWGDRGLPRPACRRLMVQTPARQAAASPNVGAVVKRKRKAPRPQCKHVEVGLSDEDDDAQSCRTAGPQGKLFRSQVPLSIQSPSV